MAVKLGAVKRDLAALGFAEVGGSMVKQGTAIKLEYIGPSSDGKVKLTITNDAAGTREVVIERQSQLARALQG